MADLDIIMQRVNDTVVQTRMDRRTLATIYQFFIHKGIHVNSLADLLRVALEEYRWVLVNMEDAQEIISTDDATVMLQSLGKASLNPSSRNMYTHVKQMQRESLYLDGGHVGQVDVKRTKHMEEKRKDEWEKAAPEALKMYKEQLKQEGSGIESIEAAQQRREGEQKDVLSELAKPPKEESE